MIILITGASHTGKTVLAQKMLEKYKYPYMSMDHVKRGLIRSGNTDLTPEDDDELTGYLWPIVREIIKTAIENDQNLIIEGCYVPDSWREDFEEEYLNNIWFICLAMTDGYIDSHFEEIRGHASDVENRLDDSWLNKDRLKLDNQKYIEAFSALDGQFFLIDSDYSQVIADILATN